MVSCYFRYSSWPLLVWDLYSVNKSDQPIVTCFPTYLTSSFAILIHCSSYRLTWELSPSILGPSCLLVYNTLHANSLNMILKLLRTRVRVKIYRQSLRFILSLNSLLFPSHKRKSKKSQGCDTPKNAADSDPGDSTA